jgi:hypothetical protein
MLNSSDTHSLSKLKKNQQKIATEQVKTATRSKLITFKTRETQNKALKMKNRKSKCLILDSTDNLKCHMIYFCVGFKTTNENQWRKILPTQSMILC